MGQDAPSSKFRLLVYLPLLEKMGWGYKIVTGGTVKKWKILQIAPKYDLIFIQKKLYSSLYLRLLKWRNRNIIFDFDDALFAPGKISKPFRLSGPGTRLTKRRLRLVFGKAEHVIAGNSFLANYAKPFAKKISIIPTPVRLSDYFLREKKSEGRIIIGWIGTGRNVLYLREIEEVMRTISAQFPQVEWRVLSDWTYELERVPIRNIPWDDSTWSEELSCFDIGLMPLTDDDWSRGKSAFKILQYMAVGIPPVASPVGMNSDVIDDGVTGYLAADYNEWVDKLTRLIDDGVLRHRIGGNARRMVEENFSLEACWEKLHAVLESLPTR